jgi:hypothetical protein
MRAFYLQPFLRARPRDRVGLDTAYQRWLSVPVAERDLAFAASLHRADQAKTPALAGAF